MTNYEKMLELTGDTATKEQVKSWAYMNRVTVSEMCYDKPFECMEKSVDVFSESDKYELGGNEHENWDRFLDCDFVEVTG